MDIIYNNYFHVNFFLQYNLAESHINKIPIKEIQPETMKLILDYVYTGSVTLTEDTVQGVLSASNMFQMIALRSGCAHYMMKHVSYTLLCDVHVTKNTFKLYTSFI